MKRFKNSFSLTELKPPTMLPVNGGEFLIGTSNEDIQTLQLKQSDWAYDWTDNDLFENEQPRHTVQIATFEIAQYPVSNLDYFQFTIDSGYRLPRSWKGFTFPDSTADHPVVSVSKLDAEAYITWLNRRTREQYRLPTEVEWEAASRGKDGRIYPWGNTFDPWRCNTSESAKRATTPLGAYSPSGDSPCGAADMVGNVWEWTSTIFEPYPYTTEDGREEPKPKSWYVIRGGAWYYSRKLARCAVREEMLESSLSLMIGFRLARSIDPAKLPPPPEAKQS